jgi:hypothetical protein
MIRKNKPATESPKDITFVELERAYFRLDHRLVT